MTERAKPLGKGQRKRSIPAEVIGDLAPASIAKALFTVAGVVLGIGALFMLHKILLLMFLGMFVATVIDPGVQRLEGWGVPRSLAVLLHFAVFLGLAAFLFISLVPIIAEQIAGLASLSTTEVNAFFANPTVALPFVGPSINHELSGLLQATMQQLSIQQLPDALSRLSGFLSSAAIGSIQMATDAAAFVVRFLLDMTMVMLFAFFFEMERAHIFGWCTQFLNPEQRAYAEQKATLIYDKLSQWAKGQLVLCLIIGTLVFILLSVLRVPYALTLAVLAGFTEFIPYVGPFIAAVPGIFISLAQGGFAWALIVAGSYYAVQWSENNFIVPLVMRKATDISPVATFSAMLIGISFPSVIHPVLGILLAIPVASIIGIFLDDLRRKPASVVQPDSDLAPPLSSDARLET